MSISKAQIFNITLNILGVSSPIENANSTDSRAILLNNYYELARDYVLKDFDWNFACTYRRLTPILDYDFLDSYNYSYDYPNDCICARNLFQTNSYKLEKFIISSTTEGTKVILTNVPDAILRYTKRINKEIYFTSEFSMALSYYLASLTSNVITGSIQKGEIAYDKYLKLIKHAKLLNAQEGSDIEYDTDTYIESRN